MFGCKRRRVPRGTELIKTDNNEKVTNSSSVSAAPPAAASTSRRTSGATAAFYSLFKSNPFNSNNNSNVAAITNKCDDENYDVKKPLALLPLIPGFAVENDAVMLWSFPMHISQTRLADRKTPSNACCLIATALAEVIYRNGIYLPVWDGTNCIDIDALYFSTKQNQSRGLPIQSKQNLLPSRLCEAMVNAIVNGNTHADAAFDNGRKLQLFNIPTSLELLGSSFGEITYVTTKSEHGDSTSLLYGNLKSAIEHSSLSDWKQLFFLTMFVERCVLIVYERDTDMIAILDSHTHRQFGALIAVSNHGNLNHFCTYIIKKFFPETLLLKPEKMKFELSLLFFQGILNDLDTPIDGRKSLKRAATLKRSRPNVFENYEKCLKEMHWKQSHYIHIKKKKGIFNFWKKI